MTRRTVQHATIVVERSLRATPARVFAAWASPDERRHWDVPGDDSWVVVEHEQDFRVGGRERSRFGPAGDPAYLSDGTYLDIVPDQRIITAGTMHDRDGRVTATLCTVEIYPEGSQQERQRQRLNRSQQDRRDRLLDKQTERRETLESQGDSKAKNAKWQAQRRQQQRENFQRERQQLKKKQNEQWN